jgi:hypothetical protein
VTSSSLPRGSGLVSEIGELPRPRSSRGSAPGSRYDPTVEGEFKAVLGQCESDPLSTESIINGNYNSLCFFEGYKGATQELPVPEFTKNKAR